MFLVRKNSRTEGRKSRGGRFWRNTGHSGGTSLAGIRASDRTGERGETGVKTGVILASRVTLRILMIVNADSDEAALTQVW